MGKDGGKPVNTPPWQQPPTTIPSEKKGGTPPGTQTRTSKTLPK